jgi:TatD DNase family protein
VFIDTHVHLQHAKYTQDLDDVLARAGAAQITAAIVPGTDLESSRAAVALAERHAEGPCALYAAVGLHPTEAHAYTAAVDQALRELAQHPRVVAIGEIGLDFYWPRVPDRGWPCAEPDQQIEALAAQLALAAELGLPVILHDREAHTEILRRLKAWVQGGVGRTGTLHAYAGGPEHLDEALELGFYIGMDGPVTFKKAKALHRVAQQVPLERLLLETDGPYLTPQPHRGRRNEPAYLPHIARRIADLRGGSVQDVAETTTHNARSLFLTQPTSSQVQPA